MCTPVLAPLKQLFSRGGDPRELCKNLLIDILVAKDTDPVWSDKHSWVWSQKPSFANDFVRVFTCRDGTRMVQASGPSRP